MKKRLLLALVASASMLSTAAADYKPLLEDGKKWTCQYDGTNWLGFNRYSLGIGMAYFTHQFSAEVAGDTIIDGKQCKRILCSNSNLYGVGNEFFLHEEGETVSILSCQSENVIEPVTKFIPLMKFNVSVGDKLSWYYYYEGLSYDEFMDKYYPDQPKDEDSYSYVQTISTVKGIDGVERREIAIDGSSWVEGVGFSCGHNLIAMIISGSAPYNPMSFKTIDCSINGQSIFKQKDFALQFGKVSSTEKLFTPGKSWTMARGNEEFTVSVVGDTLVNSVVCTVLADSYGKKYVVSEERGVAYGCFDHYGDANPLSNAVPLINCGLAVNSVCYRYDFGAEYNPNDLEYQHRHECKVQSVNTLTVNGVDRKEWVLEDESGNVVATWVEGVGAPDARSWAMQMPADYDLRMIDCRQDGEVIFTAEDFTHQSGIREVSTDGAKRTGAYDLQGRRVDHPTRGLYIINGKKTLLK
ncbi:MAG: hypothetical protein K2M40_02780 [Muribaculaceae bacterium]|nr:hypothetical protein [Muribaculaceae bacterium]